MNLEDEKEGKNTLQFRVQKNFGNVVFFFLWQKIQAKNPS